VGLWRVGGSPKAPRGSDPNKGSFSLSSDVLIESKSGRSSWAHAFVSPSPATGSGEDPGGRAGVYPSPPASQNLHPSVSLNPAPSAGAGVQGQRQGEGEGGLEGGAEVGKEGVRPSRGSRRAL